MENRIIKFRAWDGHEMVEVYEIVFYPNGSRKINDKIDSNYDRWQLMQFTGLTDKHNKDIYEGDIVKWDDGSRGKYWRVAIVFYDEKTAMFSFRITKNALYELSTEDGYVFGGNFAYRNKRVLETIGNLYENPELLKEKTQ